MLRHTAHCPQTEKVAFFCITPNYSLVHWKAGAALKIRFPWWPSMQLHCFVLFQDLQAFGLDGHCLPLLLAPSLLVQPHLAIHQVDHHHHGGDGDGINNEISPIGKHLSYKNLFHWGANQSKANLLHS